MNLFVSMNYQKTFEYIEILYNVSPSIVDNYFSQYKIDYEIKLGDFLICYTCCISDNVRYSPIDIYKSPQNY
jgi:hypothetical protein